VTDDVGYGRARRADLGTPDVQPGPYRCRSCAVRWVTATSGARCGPAWPVPDGR